MIEHGGDKFKKGGDGWLVLGKHGWEQYTGAAIRTSSGDLIKGSEPTLLPEQVEAVQEAEEFYRQKENDIYLALVTSAIQSGNETPCDLADSVMDELRQRNRL